MRGTCIDKFQLIDNTLGNCTELILPIPCVTGYLFLVLIIVWLICRCSCLSSIVQQFGGINRSLVMGYAVATPSPTFSPSPPLLSSSSWLTFSRRIHWKRIQFQLPDKFFRSAVAFIAISFFFYVASSSSFSSFFHILFTCANCL